MIYILISALIVILDRISKYFVVKLLKPLGTVPMVKGFFRLTYAENTGAAFSMLSEKTVLLATVSGIVILLLSFFLIRAYKLNPGKILYLTSIAMILGGAAGNWIDRTFFGYVIDFFDFEWINFAVFNVADSFITIGAIIFCAVLLFDNAVKL